MKTFAVLSALVGAALAQSSVSSAAGATSTSNPLIPSGISSTCSDYLQQLNSNSTLSACTSSIITATSSFSPTSSDSSSSSSVNSTLNQLCSSSSCTASTFRSLLADFYLACSAELSTTNLNQDVLRQYDVMYSLTPFQQAVCSQDSSGNYCVLSMPSTTGSAASASASASAGVKNLLASASDDVSDVTNYLYSPLSKRSLSPRDQTTLIVPNTTTFGSTNLLFLFLNSGMSSSELCTSCTSSIMSAYINFESNVPYGPGLANSALLSGQSTLYTQIESECGSSFLSGTVQAAGGISAGIAHSDAVSSVTLGFGGIFATALAAIAASLV